jgi:hypothetical protein
MTLKPWYQVVYPSEGLLENRLPDAAESAVRLDQVCDDRARATIETRSAISAGRS